jgi:hypothetical protein
MLLLRRPSRPKPKLDCPRPLKFRFRDLLRNQTRRRAILLLDNGSVLIGEGTKAQREALASIVVDVEFVSLCPRHAVLRVQRLPIRLATLYRIAKPGRKSVAKVKHAAGRIPLARPSTLVDIATNWSRITGTVMLGRWCRGSDGARRLVPEAGNGVRSRDETR